MIGSKIANLVETSYGRYPTAIRRLGRAVRLLLVLVPLSTVGSVRADSAVALQNAYAAYASLTPITAAAGIDMALAEDVQRMLVLNLRPRWGEVAGYKAALTSASAQQRFGVSGPVTGVFMENMFTSTGSTIDRTLAVRPVLEADLLVRIADERINDATTPEQVLESLSEVIPFVEIPDLMYAAGVDIRGPDIVAINAGARIGVVGQPLALSAMEDPMTRLAQFTVEVIDARKVTIAEGSGSALMGHPLKAALWLKNDLARQGYRLEAGDLLSLGSMGPPIPLDDLDRITATYRGLDRQPQSIHIGFR